MKKLLSLLVVLCMMACMLPALAAAEEELPVVTWFTADGGTVEYPYSFTDRPVMAKIVEIARERFGIQLVDEVVIPSEFKTILSTRMAAGESMPSVIRCSPSDVSGPELINYYNQGLLVDLAQYQDVMPNYFAALEDYPGVKSATMDTEGHVLAVSQIVVNPQHITNWLALEMAWLEKLGLEVPSTPDELKAVLLAFQENDMNGDGMPNETLNCNNWTAMNQVLYPSFGEGRMAGPRDSWALDADGNVYNTAVSDGAKEMIAYLADLYAAGLIWDQSFATPTSEESTQYRISGQMAGGFGMFWDGLLWDTSQNGYGLDSKWAPVQPLNDKITVTNYSGGVYYAVTSACEAPEKVAAFLDWFYTVEGTQISYYGEATPGGDYYVRDTSKYDELGLTAADYELIATQKYYDELANETNLNIKLGANTCFPHYLPGMADQVAADFYFSYAADVVGLNADVNYVKERLNWAMENGTYDLLFSAMTAEQSDIITSHSDLFNFMEEKEKAFISGVEPLENWDAYVEQCNAMGLAEVTAVMQARLVTE